MRERRSSRGRGRNGGSRGRYNSDNGSRNSRGNSRGRYNNRRRNNKRSFDNGNLRERITVESGYLVLIDQFMLANPQFTEKLSELIDDEPEAKDELIRKFGGDVVEIEPGTYKVDRNPYSMTIFIHPEGFKVDRRASQDNDPKDAKGTIFVDTRCLAMIDRELLDDIRLIEKYQQWWFGDQNKACRDLLRDNGGAVRYGFSKEHDELNIHFNEEDNTLCLQLVNIPEKKSKRSEKSESKESDSQDSEIDEDEETSES